MKITFYILIALFFFQDQVFAQNPGSVGTTNLTAWFKADNLAVGNVINWTTTFPTGASAISVTDNVSPFPFATNTPINNTSNYNTTIEFTSNSNTAIKALQNTTPLNLLDNRNSSSQGTFFGVYYFPTYIRNNNHMMLYNESNGDAIQFRNLNANGRFAIGRGLGVSTNATRNWVENHLPTIISYKGNRSNATSMIALENSKTFTTTSASQSSGQVGLHFGLMPGNSNSPFNGYLNEFIFYNRDLTFFEMNKIHTYLAVKYGITLDNVGGGTQGDYIATNGVVIWDASVTPAYHNDVIGIGRDDSEGLLQKQSHSFDDITRIYLNVLQTNNIGNNGTFVQDTSYVMVGDNGGLTCSRFTTTMEVPSSPLLNSRLEREWKVTKTNFSQVFNIDITISPCATGNDFDTTCLALLVDDDGDFTNASVFNSSSGLNFSVTGNTITVSGISNLHVPDGTTKYLTLASVVFSKEFGNDTTKCEGDSVLLDAGNTGATYLWNNGKTSKTIYAKAPGVYSVIIFSNECAEYDTIVVTDQIVTASFLTLDTASCIPLTSQFSDLSSINSGVISNWNWNFGDGGTSTLQNPIHVYPSAGAYSVSLTATSNLGCTDDTIVNSYINAYSLAISDFSFSPSFGAPRDVISFNNISTNAIDYKWYFGDGDSSSVMSPVHSYTEEGVYEIILIAINANGCNDTTSFFITIKSDNFFIPNSFTPSDDGKNDIWRIIGLEETSLYELKIFNRWGELVFSTTDPLEEWDGKFLGEDCPSGIYPWNLRYKRGGIEIFDRQGHVNLLR